MGVDFRRGRFAGMALEAERYRVLFGKRRQGFHPQVDLFLEAGLADDFEVPPAGAVARFAIDAQRLEPGVEALFRIIPPGGNLAAVTVLAVGRFRDGSERALGWPVGQISLQRDFAAYGRPRQVCPQLDEPKLFAPDKIERQETH